MRGFFLFREFRILNSEFRIAATSCLALLVSTLTVAAPIDVRLIQAVRDRQIESVRALLRQRLDVNAAQGDGATALHWAAHLDDLAIADLLIRAGARVDAANDAGATPLHLACTNRSAPMVERLLAAGANARAALTRRRNGVDDLRPRRRRLGGWLRCCATAPT